MSLTSLIHQGLSHCLDGQIASPSLVIILASSLVSHFICSKYELWPQHLLPIFCFLFIGTLYGQYKDSIVQALLNTFSIVSEYLTFLFASIAVYRLFFHRLCQFPGPKKYALSKWSMVFVDLEGTRYLAIDEAHKKYGDIVRTGPRELSINDASIIPAIYGSQSRCIKGPWYSGIAGGRPTNKRSVYELIDKSTHTHRKRIWNTAMSSTSRATYIVSINHLIERMIEKLKQKASKVHGEFELDITEYCTMFSFDVMGVIGFSKSFNLIEQGEKSCQLRQLQASVKKAQVIGHIPYMSKCLDWLPGNPIHLFKCWVRDAVQTSEKTVLGTMDIFGLPIPGPNANSTIQTSDIMSHLIASQFITCQADILKFSSTQNRKLMEAEGMLLCVGGSDTASAALTSILYQIVKHPGVVERIRKEVSKVFESKDDEITTQVEALKNECPLLNASIKEALRIFPPGLSGLQRITPKEGLTLRIRNKNVYIPGNIIVSTPPFTINKDPINFSPSPLQFRPERWINSKEEERLNAAALIPFGFGPTGCVGREIAKAEIRLLISKLICTFDLAFAQDFQTEQFESGIRDLFTLHASYPLRLHLRKCM